MSKLYSVQRDFLLPPKKPSNKKPPLQHHSRAPANQCPSPVSHGHQMDFKRPFSSYGLIYMFKNIRPSHSPAVSVKLLKPVFQDRGSFSVNGVVGVFQPPALTIWIFSLAVCQHLEYFISFQIVKVTGTIWLQVNLLYLYCGTNQIIGFLGMLSHLNPIGYAPLIIHILLKRTRKSKEL